MIKILWGVFYIITAFIILLFFVKEKLLTEKINLISDKLIEKINLTEKNNDNKILYINILNLIIILAMFVFFMDKTRSDILPLKRVVLFSTIGINAILLVLNNRKEYLFILNLVMFFAADDFFGIYDTYFKYTMLVSLIFILISIFLDTQKLKEKSRMILNSIFLLILVYILQSHYLGNYNIPTQSMEPTILAGDRIFSNNVIYKFKDPQLNDIISFFEPLENKVMYTKRITGIPGTVFNISNNKVMSDSKDISQRIYSYGNGSIYQLLKSDIYIPKKGDTVKIYKMIEYNFDTGEVNLVDTKEFLNMYKDYDFTKLIGIYNMNDLSIKKRYSFLMLEKNHDEILLPILDFKYDKKTFISLLSGEEVKLKEDYYLAMGDNTDNSQDSRYFGYVAKSRIKGKLFLRWYPFNRIGKIKDEF